MATIASGQRDCADEAAPRPGGPAAVLLFRRPPPAKHCDHLGAAWLMIHQQVPFCSRIVVTGDRSMPAFWPRSASTRGPRNRIYQQLNAARWNERPVVKVAAPGVLSSVIMLEAALMIRSAIAVLLVATPAIAAPAHRQPTPSAVQPSGDPGSITGMDLKRKAQMDKADRERVAQQKSFDDKMGRTMNTICRGC